jgi:hypothetical protein
MIRTGYPAVRGITTRQADRLGLVETGSATIPYHGGGTLIVKHHDNSMRSRHGSCVRKTAFATLRSQSSDSPPAARGLFSPLPCAGPELHGRGRGWASAPRPSDGSRSFFPWPGQYPAMDHDTARKTTARKTLGRAMAGPSRPIKSVSTRSLAASSKTRLFGSAPSIRPGAAVHRHTRAVARGGRGCSWPRRLGPQVWSARRPQHDRGASGPPSPLIPILLMLERPRHWHPDIGRLSRRELRQMGAHLAQVQRRHLLVELLGQHIDPALIPALRRRP